METTYFQLVFCLQLHVMKSVAHIGNIEKRKQVTTEYVFVYDMVFDSAQNQMAHIMKTVAHIGNREKRKQVKTEYGFVYDIVFDSAQNQTAPND